MEILMTLKILKIGGAVLAFAACVVSQVVPPDFSTGAFWVGLAGLITAFGAILKEYYNERQRMRDHEFEKIKFHERAEANKDRIKDLARWALAAKRKYPGLPDPPAVELDTTEHRILVTPDPDNPGH